MPPDVDQKKTGFAFVFEAGELPAIRCIRHEYEEGADGRLVSGVFLAAYGLGFRSQNNQPFNPIRSIYGVYIFN